MSACRVCQNLIHNLLFLKQQHWPLNVCVCPLPPIFPTMWRFWTYAAPLDTWGATFTKFRAVRSAHVPLTQLELMVFTSRTSSVFSSPPTNYLLSEAAARSHSCCCFDSWETRKLLSLLLLILLLRLRLKRAQGFFFKNSQDASSIWYNSAITHFHRHQHGPKDYDFGTCLFGV